MKKILYAFAIAVILMTACKTKTETAPVDTEAAKSAVSALMDKYNSAFSTKDAGTMMSLLTEDGMAYGTDPSEIWTKKQLSDYWTQSLTDTSLKVIYKLDRREVRISKDGNSAIVVEQSTFTMMPKIPMRCIYHAVRVDDKWMFDFISWGCLAKNEDIPKLIKALE